EVVEGRHPGRAEGPLDRLGLAAALGVADVHAEAAGAAGDGLADPAEADDAELHAVHARAEEERRRPPRESAGADEPVALADAPGGRDEEAEGEVGRRLREHVRRV